MLTEDQIAEFETTHNRIAHVIGKDKAWEVVVRKPTRSEFKRFKAMVHNPSQAPDAMEHLIRTCVVYPSRDALDALLEDFPALPAAFDSQLAELVGAAADETVK